MSAILAAAPALPLHTAGKYVAAAYVVLIALILIYVAIMAIRLSHTERELADLTREVLEQQQSERGTDPPEGDQPIEHRTGGDFPERETESVV